MPHILIVGGRDSSISKASELGLEITLFQLDRIISPYQRRHAHRLEVFDFQNHEEALSRARKIHAVHPFDAVASFWELALLPASLIGEALSLPCNPSKAVSLTRDKFATRQLFQDDAELSTAYRLCDTKATFLEFCASIGHKGILKPVDGSGSSGVASFSSLAEAEAAWTHNLKFRSPPFLAEEYIKGDEYSIETISKSGRHEILAVTQKVNSGPPHFIETGHMMPAALENGLLRAIEQTALKVLAAIGHLHGPTHMEFIVSPGQSIKLVEVQTRIGGDQIWEMVEWTTGCDQIKETYCELLDLYSPTRVRQCDFAGIAFFQVKEGIFLGADNLEEASALNGVKRILLKRKPGEEIPKMESSSSRLGYVLAVGDSKAQVTASLQQVQDTLSFNIG